jgi:hypothetical protein
MPTVDEFNYTFDRLAQIVEKFIAAIALKKYSLYLRDDGALIGYRIAAKNPERDTGHFALEEDGDAIAYIRQFLASPLQPIPA